MGSTMKQFRCLRQEMTPFGLVLTWFIVSAWKAKRERWDEMIEFVSTRVKEGAETSLTEETSSGATNTKS